MCLCLGRDGKGRRGKTVQLNTWRVRSQRKRKSETKRLLVGNREQKAGSSSGEGAGGCRKQKQTSEMGAQIKARTPDKQSATSWGMAGAGPPRQRRRRRRRRRERRKTTN